MRVFVFPGQDINSELRQVFMDAVRLDEDVFIGRVDEVWIMDLETQTMYIANKKEQKLFKIKPLEIEG